MNKESQINRIQKSFSKIKNMGDWVGLKYIREQTQNRAVRNEQPYNNETHLSKGVLIEVMVDGNLSYSCTQDLSTSGIQKAAEKAHELAKITSQHSVHKFTQDVRPKSVGKFIGAHETPFSKTSLQHINDCLMQSSRTLKNHSSIIDAHAYAMITETSQYYLSSNGSEIFQKWNLLATDFTATAQNDQDTQTRSDRLAYCYQTGGEAFNLDHMLAHAEKNREEAVELLSAKNCPTGEMNVIIAPDQMILQIHESIGHPLEMDRILGDERNYAGWSFIKPQDFGHLQYGSLKMNVTFDPHKQGEFASYGFDDCGNPATREHLIKNGKLIRGLGSLESQQRMGLPGVANFRTANWNRAPIDRMANINLEPGHDRLEDMITSIDDGVIMYTNKSWSIDDYRNKFQFGCEYAKQIKNGKVIATLKNPNYRGTTINFWNKLDMVSQVSETYGSPYCGKGEPSQIIRVGHSSPYCLFKNIEVFGGHS